MEWLVFAPLAAMAVGTAVLVIVLRNPIHCALCLVATFFALSGLYLLLQAQFIAAVQVIIYAGAIMVLFLFVLMMLNAEILTESRFIFRQWAPAILLGLIYFSLALLLVLTDPGSRVPLKTAMATPKALGRFVFGRYWLSVEMISLLLLIGLMAVIQLGRGKKENPDEEGL